MEELEQLKEKVKEFKRKTGLPYSFLARKINMNKQSFYNFMGGARGISEEKKELLKKQMERFS